MTHQNSDDYDLATDTVRVQRHDLARLLLEFRTSQAKQESGRWLHMHDYDRSFERLADAVDAGDQTRRGSRWTGPDYRMRCTTDPVYVWPEGSPHEGPVTTVHVPGHGSHYVLDPTHVKALCGFGWAPEEDTPTNDEATCTACRREHQLARHLRSTEQ
ncbi:hypothetical protein [Saccharomonospora sp. CUA-673]|uniref:hypothetical protein n=1 Tax=Saccharomonospora sp. CUA-673 TaxID=1904969 RepID=UPI001C9E68A1|nr:hypothetical protein [Saccharomonospora sp. CUA-673]